MPSVLWRRIDGTGFDRCTLRRAEGGYRLAGTALLAVDGTPFEIRYTVLVDEQWHTRTVGAHVHSDAGDRRLAMTASGTGAWEVTDAPVAELDEALDVDLSWTPATNTLPIRRLRLAPGDAAEVTAAHIAFPDTNIAALPQRYQRISEDRYRYSTGDLSAELLVDEDGLVRSYQGVWETVATGR